MGSFIVFQFEPFGHPLNYQRGRGGLHLCELYSSRIIVDSTSSSTNSGSGSPIRGGSGSGSPSRGGSGSDSPSKRVLRKILRCATALMVDVQHVVNCRFVSL